MQEDSSAVDEGAAEGLDFEEGWESIDQAPVEADMEDLRFVPGDDVVQDDEDSASQLHRALPAPKPPSIEKVRNTQFKPLALSQLVSFLCHGTAECRSTLSGEGYRFS